MLLDRDLLIRELYTGQTQILKPGVVDNPACSVPIVTVEVNVTDLDHLVLGIRGENFTHPVGQDSHEVLVDELVEARIRDDADELEFDVIVKSEVDLPDWT